MKGLEMMEHKMLLELKIKNGAVNKKLRIPEVEQIVKFGSLWYNVEMGRLGGNLTELLLLLSAGDEYDDGVVVSKRKENPTEADKHKPSLESLVPGLSHEVTADLITVAHTIMDTFHIEVVQLLVDVPCLQRSKGYYLSKIQTFFQNCKQPVGKFFISYQF